MLFEELLKQWANKQGFQTWAQDHAAVLRNLSRWMNRRFSKDAASPMCYRVIKGKGRYIAIAKKEPFTSETPSPILEPGELWFEFGDTPEQAMAKLKKSIMEER